MIKFHSELKDAIVLTPNRRSAEWIKAQLNQINTVTIMPINAFFKMIWHKLCIRDPKQFKPLLSKHQALYRWQHQIFHDTPLQLSDKILDTLWDSWRLIHQYQISFKALKETANHADQEKAVEIFQTIQSDYKAHGLVDEICLVSHLFDQGNRIADLLTVKQLKCYAFLDLSPLYTTFFSKLEGIKVETLKTPDNHQSQGLYQFDTPEEEQAAMIDWCEAAIKQKGSTACIIPNLEQIRLPLQRQLSRSLPETAFNIASPMTLKAYPLIEEIVLWLTWFHEAISRNNMIRLSQSKYFFKLNQTINWPHILEKIQSRECDYAKFYQALSPRSRENLPKTIEKSHMTFPQWHEQIRQYCNQLLALEKGTAYDKALYEKFHEQLTLLSHIRLDKAPVSYQHCLENLTWLLNSTHYEPAVNHHAPIQILGQLEAAGLSFDRVWLFGSNELNWPAPLTPNPFISLQLQKKYLIPHADPKHTLRFYQNAFEQISQASKAVIISYSTYIDDQPIQKSAFIDSTLKTSTHKKLGLFKKGKTILEAKIDHQGPQYEEDTLVGGSHALSLQAHCPFKYFAEKRLKANAIPIDSDYIDFATRGQAVHHVMANLWQQLKDQTALEEQLPNLSTLISNAIKHTFKQLNPYKIIPKTILTLESNRLFAMIWEWFQTIELKRDPFRVLQIEYEHTIEIESIAIPCRVDRLDELEDSKTLLIDYKTGLTTTQRWLETPLLEPQLPLYLLATNADGLAFAQIRYKQMAFKPLSKDNSDDWETQYNIWKKAITQLVQSIKKGNAKAAPATPSICQGCEYPRLCRIHDYECNDKTD